jgi:hypothetical protein
MADFVTPNKGYTEPTVNADAGTWGGILNSNFNIVDSNLGGVTTVNCAGSSSVLASTVEAQNLVQVLTGALTGNIDYILPAVGGMYIVANNTTGFFSLGVVTSAGGSTGIFVPQGSAMLLYSDGTNVYSANSGAVLGGSGLGPIVFALPGWVFGGGGFVGSATSWNPSGLVANLNLGTTGGTFVNFYVGPTDIVGSITTNGTTTTYNTTSDERLKIDDGEIHARQSGGIIDALTPRWFRWKRWETKAPRPGFFAQEVHAAYPWAVTKGEGEPHEASFQPWQIDKAELIPVLVAEIKALRSRLDRLERGIGPA